MNSLYEESKTTRWNLQCNAGYQSDYQLFTKDLEKSSKYKPGFPYQCPVLKDEEILQRWYVYEDLIYYSYNDDTWRSFFQISGSDRFPSSSIPPPPSIPPSYHLTQNPTLIPSSIFFYKIKVAIDSL